MTSADHGCDKKGTSPPRSVSTASSRSTTAPRHRGLTAVRARPKDRRATAARRRGGRNRGAQDQQARLDDHPGYEGGRTRAPLADSNVTRPSGRGQQRGIGPSRVIGTVDEQAVGPSEGQHPEPDRRGREQQAGEEDQPAPAQERGRRPHERQRQEQVAQRHHVHHRVGHALGQPQDRAGAQDHRPCGSMRKTVTKSPAPPEVCTSRRSARRRSASRVAPGYRPRTAGVTVRYRTP